MLSALMAFALDAGIGQELPTGQWSVTSTVIELAVPGIPGFMQRMAKGRSTSERKQLTGGQGVEALLAPDPKAACHVDSQTVGGGRYAQVLSCPQKRGAPMRVSRVGTYDATGFVGRATVTGTTPKGQINVTLSQRAAPLTGRGR